MNRQEEARGWGEQLIPDRPIPYYILQSSIARYAWVGQLGLEGSSVLEVGCGSGYGACHLLDQGAREVVAGDLSANAIAYAAQHYRKSDLHFLRLDGLRLPFGAKAFDLVLSLEVLEHVADAATHVAECCRVLRDDGVFICSTPNKTASSPDSETPRARYHTQEFYPDELQALLSRHFGEVSLYGMDPVGSYDRGLYRMATWLDPKLFSIPKVHLLINLITRFLFRRYRLVKLVEIGDDPPDRIVERRYWPSPLDNRALVYGGIIALARVPLPAAGRET